MKLIIDNSNLFAGGGLQVAASFLRDLKQIEVNVDFHVIQSISCADMMKDDVFPENFTIYNLEKSSEKSKYRRIKSVKNIENAVIPDCIFTLFGPSYHKSKFPKIVGFAIPYIIYPDSPFFKKISLKEKLYYKIMSVIKTYSFKKYSDALIFETENARRIFMEKKKYRKQSFTVGNTLNEIFFKPDCWVDYLNVPNSSCNILFLTANYPHKNMMILPEIISVLKEKFNMQDFKFLITLPKSILDFPQSANDHIEYLGKVELQKIPSLYKQSDIVFIPTLLEVFSATYLEAMFMKKPIVTSDLGFSRDICGDSAYFCEPTKAEFYAEGIFKVSHDQDFSDHLIKLGTKNLERFGSSLDRTKNYMKIIDTLIKDYDNKR